MALSGYPFPYDVNNLLTGAVRVMYADPEVTAVSEDPTTVFDFVYPYAVNTGWVDLGATRDAFSYSRSFDTEGLEIQQVKGNVLEEITSIARSLEVSMAEFAAEGFALMEGAQGIVSVNPANGVHAGYDKVSYGSFNSLKRYRIAFASQRPLAAGSVTEPVASGGRQRGRFVVGIAHQCQLSADEITLEQDKGALTAAGLTFSMFPDGTVTDAEKAWGTWAVEDAGTIAAGP